ncbi:alpha/beta hydrolase family protein [Granulicella tundricola]|uniref:Putative lipoprotein transmembrane n=1 Tax=Granulicella tundricola (strain ATCC BAA-1859 / DSM 23138 / MP5ACTX9) TaxID=1198114 RepID=E8X182_GRATM|nr:lipoprotein transmembrane [Granulicella tundricola]ADW69036.1 putative lipoprotein transmembrane [Granulicella tundricola MP5ACTX9]
MPRYAASNWGWVALTLIVGGTAAIISRAAFWQKKNEVAIRPPGVRLLLPPQPAQSIAAGDLPYALISCSAYDSLNPNDKKAKRCPNGSADLGDEWQPWIAFPDAELQTEMASVHLRARVWENKSKGLLVVSFGGTEAGSWNDWKSNFRWTQLWQKDEYTVLGSSYVRSFAEELARRRTQPGQEYLGKVTLISTGHSLGAGLAEKFAYSLPAREFGIQHVDTVFAFDTSPVTTFLNTARNVRQENVIGLKIVRIYERGEGLAIVRAIASVVHKPSTVNPEVSQRRYNLFGDDRFGTTNPVASHSIAELAEGLKKVAAGSN